MDESDLLYPPGSDEYQQGKSRYYKYSHYKHTPVKKKWPCFRLPCNICVKSKASMLILLWSVIIGAIYISLLNSFSVLGFSLQSDNNYRAVIWTVLGAYTLLALIRLTYPLSGFLADTYCGRYRAVTISFIVLLVAMLSLSISAALGFGTNFHITSTNLRVAAPFTLFVVISLLLITAGLAGYQANIIQFGLDQLLEAPSKNLGLFIHWLMWTHTLGGFIIHIMFAILPCHLGDEDPQRSTWTNTLASLPFIYLVTLTLLLIFTCYNHNWFYSEPGQNNPYKTVFKVLNFARKNKHPLRRSAFTYCDEERPQRIDFGKERYGGPFTTEQVEDVKTFLRIVLVLLTLGPVFTLEVPASYYIYPFFALHISPSVEFRNNTCDSISRWVVLESGGLGYIVSILFLPVYMWVVYSFLQNRVPKILCRLWCAFVVALTGVVCLLVIDLVGHIRYQQRNQTFGRVGDKMCMFTIDIVQLQDKPYTTLDLPSAVNILPSFFLNLGFLLIQITAFEFISAQSPLSMKGLLVGVYFAIKGVFQCLSAVVVVPFALRRIWIDKLGKHPPVTNCAFGYYIFTITVASIGLVLFSLVVTRYKYRQRDERPYDQRFAEQYYQRCISERIQNPVGGNSQDETEKINPDVNDLESSTCDYGTIETDIELSESTSSMLSRNGAWLDRAHKIN